MCKSCGPVDVDVEVAYRVHRDASNEYVAGLCIGHEFPRGLELMAELNGTYDVGDKFWTKWVNVGTRYRLGNGATFLGSVGQGIGHFDGPKPWIGYLGLQFDF